MPTTLTGKATDLITFTRDSLATVTDGDGKIKWAPHNLLSASEQFDASSWTQQGLSGVTANSLAAPNGTTTADKITENGSNDFHYVVQTNVIDDSAPVSTLSVFAKAAERQYLNLALSWGANYVAATFDVSGNTVTSDRTGGTGVLSVPPTITPVGGSWYLCTLRGTIGTTGSDAASIALSNTATPTGVYPQYAGTNGHGMHLWGASLTRSDLGGMQANASAYPYYNPTTPKNLLAYSEAFDNAAWVKTDATLEGNGVELVANGDFSGGTTGWTTLQAENGGLPTQSVSNGILTVNGDGASVNGFSQQLTGLTVGATYRVVGTVVSSNGNAYISVHATLPRYSGNQAVVSFGAQTGTRTFSFTATTSNPYINLSVYQTAVVGFSNISVQEVAAYAAPNGSLTAEMLTASAGTVFPQVLQATSVYATAKMVSVYAKAGTYGILQMFNAYGAVHYANFNLSAGVVGTKGASVLDSGMVPLGNGWYRCWAHFIALDDVGIGMAGSASATKQATWTAAGTETIYLWGAQLSDSASLDPYSPVFGAAPSAAAYHGPRLDYDGDTLAARGLLVEEARTNLLQQSADFTTTWSLNNPGSRTANTDAAPDGTVSADTITDDITGNFTSVRQTVTIANNSAAYTASVFVKKTTGAASFPGLGMSFTGGSAKYASVAINTNTGVATGRTGEVPDTISVVPVGNYWRVAITASNNNSGNTSLIVDIVAAVNTDAGATWTAATTGSAVIWGAQLEAGAFATSYIQNVNSPAGVTRNADVASVGVSQFPYSASEGTIVAAYSPLTTSGATRGVFALTAGTNNDNYADWRPNSSQMLVVSGGVQSADLYPGGGAVGAVSKGALVLKANDFAACVNGGTVQTGPSGAVPVGIDRLLIGYLANNSIYAICGHIRQITYIPRRLTNAELQSRTA